ncbi:T9SS type A sorting domain-containing protein [Aquimarina sp. ERC-38]|uniref:T9SS type A sorting domain-containing protein n=1 Tax=Aquimarina sp. ERC-38 TaxID=2949996 RepID=UPI00224839B9|nr:T9SS type A sorting domain-containing protein [Aquimarina sp. ERC-38]UZO82591.1 T9SS type A sorting domain-containing protein [Aquimarina sp. ERC-38]
MKKNTKWSILAGSLLLAAGTLSAQVEVDVNIDVNHSVGSSNSFDRSKWMTIHSSQGENDWNGDLDKLDYIINDLDVYFGRDTGLLRFSASLTKEDPNKPGFASVSDIKAEGNKFKNRYISETNKHAFEKGDVMMAFQQVPFYPNGQNALNINDRNSPNWFFSKTDTAAEPFGTATGDFLVEFLNGFFGDGGTSGHKKPEYFEVMNEPIWPLVERNLYGGGNIDDIFKFHETIADKVHTGSPGVKVGGFCTAFPDPDLNNFNQWGQRWKRFIDQVGPKMDFYSYHLYDFPIFPNRPSYRKGGRNEVTFEIIEQYNYLKYGEVKPSYISEYGAQTHMLNNNQWSSLRDWYNVEAFNAMLMQMLERANTIDRAIPFAVAKAEWGKRTVNGRVVPYSSRLLKKTTEPASYNGNDWEWTDFIKFYELWSDVKGLRADSFTTELNLQVDSYVDGNKAYVILNNIKPEAMNFKLNIYGTNNNSIQNIEVKRMFLKNNAITALETTNVSNFSGVQTIRDNETIILKYTFASDVTMNRTSEEFKYYANSYNQAIGNNRTVNFTFDQTFNLGTNGEAMLRLGIYRAHNKMKRPASILVNGTQIQNIPTTVYRGDNQNRRPAFFSMLEIPIDYKLLKSTNNTVRIIFPDSGGSLTTAALQTFKFSSAIPRTKDDATLDVETIEAPSALSLYPNPTSSIVNITGSFEEWEVFSITGKFLQRGTANQLDLSSLSSGIYFVTFDKNKQTSRKIVKL